MDENFVRFTDICLVLAVVTYTIFIIVMFVANFNGNWVRNEAPWQSYDSQYETAEFTNNVQDPNLQATL